MKCWYNSYPWKTELFEKNLSVTHPFIYYFTYTNIKTSYHLGPKHTMNSYSYTTHYYYSYGIILPRVSTTRIPKLGCIYNKIKLGSKQHTPEYHKFHNSKYKAEPKFYYRKDILNLYIILYIYSLVFLLSCIFPFPAMHSLLTSIIFYRLYLTL